MPLFDFEKGCYWVDPDSLEKLLAPDVATIGPRSWKVMVRTMDTAIGNLNPSVSSQLVWTILAAMVGYNSNEPTRSTNHLWEKAFTAVKQHPDRCNKLVGLLAMWRISLQKTDKWFTSKTQDKGGIHPYRTYWINNNARGTGGHTMGDLINKFSS
jgi:hypothetical protein